LKTSYPDSYRDLIFNSQLIIFSFAFLAANTVGNTAAIGGNGFFKGRWNFIFFCIGIIGIVSIKNKFFQSTIWLGNYL